MSKTILHLDDEPAIREILAAHLSNAGYTVVSVASPDEAMNAVRQSPPDLFISDLQLEEGDGLDTVAQVRAALPKLPIIILTGVLIDPKVAKQTVARHVDAYVPKTAPLTRIMEEVQRLTGG